MQYFLIALALAMDAFAVSMSAGACTKNARIKDALLIALYFGFFQFFMPVLGWFAGSSFQSLIENFDHWIAFGLLVILGGKMLFEAFSENEEKCFSLSHKNLALFALATSIDALGVGFSYSFLETSILFPAILIGVITFILSFAGVFIGKMWGHVLEQKAEILGGMILIAIGCKILAEHLHLFSF